MPARVIFNYLIVFARKLIRHARKPQEYAVDSQLGNHVMPLELPIANESVGLGRGSDAIHQNVGI